VGVVQKEILAAAFRLVSDGDPVNGDLGTAGQVILGPDGAFPRLLEVVGRGGFGFSCHLGLPPIAWATLPYKWADRVPTPDAGNLFGSQTGARSGHQSAGRTPLGT
jgi:hypothetical protein